MRLPPVSGQMFDRPWLHPQVRFVAFRRVRCRLASSSADKSRSWTIEGVGPTPQEADCDLMRNVREFTGRTHRPTAGRADIRIVLKGRRMTALEIARALGCPSRKVQLTLCNSGWGWIARDWDPERKVYVYFLTTGAS